MNYMKLLNIRIHFLFLVFVTILISHTAFSFTNHVNSIKINKDSIVRILAIGNSFSDDAVEHYLYGLAKEGGYKVIIGNLYIGGCPLDRHWGNAREGKAAYDYRKIDVDGNKKKFPKTAMSKVLAEEPWDFISFQQASSKSGLYKTYIEPLPLLFNYVKEKATNPNVKFVFHQTWAYSKDSKHKGYVSYDNDQTKMYNAIMTASSKAMKLVKLDRLVPSGTAIQNARTSFVGDNLCRDGYHLNVLGRYTASCTWYETLFGENVIGYKYAPEKVSEKEAAMAQHAAHNAVKKPYKVTKLKKFLK